MLLDETKRTLKIMCAEELPWMVYSSTLLMALGVKFICACKIVNGYCCLNTENRIGPFYLASLSGEVRFHITDKC